MAGRHVARMRYTGNDCRILVRIPVGKHPLGSPRRKRDDDINIDVREGGRWMKLAHCLL